jgi:hypothetical protein
MDRDRLEYWPAHLQSVFAVIGRSLGDKRLVPDVLDSLPGACGSIVAAHRVTVAYVRGKRAGPRSGHYIVTIVGPRINACWKFRAIDLEKLSRAVAQAVGRKSASRDGGYELGAEVW